MFIVNTDKWYFESNFKCYSLNVVRACSIVVHKWVWKLGCYISPLSLLFSAISISNTFTYYFTLVSVVFLNPFMDFDSVFKLLEYAGTLLCSYNCTHTCDFSHGTTHFYSVSKVQIHAWFRPTATRGCQCGYKYDHAWVAEAVVVHAWVVLITMGVLY